MTQVLVNNYTIDEAYRIYPSISLDDWNFLGSRCRPSSLSVQGSSVSASFWGLGCHVFFSPGGFRRFQKYHSTSQVYITEKWFNTSMVEFAPPSHVKKGWWSSRLESAGIQSRPVRRMAGSYMVMQIWDKRSAHCCTDVASRGFCSTNWQAKALPVGPASLDLGAEPFSQPRAKWRDLRVFCVLSDLNAGHLMVAEQTMHLFPNYLHDIFLSIIPVGSSQKPSWSPHDKAKSNRNDGWETFFLIYGCWHQGSYHSGWWSVFNVRGILNLVCDFGAWKKTQLILDRKVEKKKRNPAQLKEHLTTNLCFHTCRLHTRLAPKKELMESVLRCADASHDDSQVLAYQSFVQHVHREEDLDQPAFHGLSTPLMQELVSRWVTVQVK